MITLIIDTSTENALFALAESSRLIASREYPHQNQLSKTLFPALQDLLAEAKLPLDKVDGFAVGIGPGSYTGTRVGVAAVKSLAFALDKPLISFSSPEAFLPSKEGAFLSVWEAKYGDPYLLKGTHCSGRFDYEIVGFAPLERHKDSMDNVISPSLSSGLKPLFNPSALAKVVYKKITTTPLPSAEEISPLYFSSFHC